LRVKSRKRSRERKQVPQRFSHLIMVLLIHTLTSLTHSLIQVLGSQVKERRSSAGTSFKDFSFHLTTREGEMNSLQFLNPLGLVLRMKYNREQSTQVFFSPEMQVKGEKTRERQGNKRREKKVKATQVVEQQNKKWAKETGLWKPGFG